MSALVMSPSRTTHDLAAALPRGHWGEATENRARKMLDRLEKRGLVAHFGAGSSAAWYLTLQGRSALQ